ncbi:hypothetical protein VNO80_28089 [Phaseolus coccineus]|uniref:IST1-like protein n=1 Tax=Phaseolus coccineus TaxID=3886 RepID=A0AAN9QHU7_PHACN
MLFTLLRQNRFRTYFSLFLSSEYSDHLDPTCGMHYSSRNSIQSGNDGYLKSRLKLINRRLETIGKKRKAVQKFLKKDIVDLLGYALDYNAYGRAEGLLVDQNMLLCYELVGKFANCVLSHVRDLCKQRDCPDECKEAIQSLIYAAARFSDLPELRELRTLFTPKFGNTLEPYICKEFVDKLRQVPPSKEMKIQLLRDLAQEFYIEWDSKALEERLHSPPLLLEDKTKYDHLRQ